MKKKKKSSKKKAAFDLEAFEKELNESKKESGEGKPKTKTAEDEDEDDVPVDTSHLDNLDESELGENPFSRPDAPVGVDAGTEAWLSSDRDYTYQEVRSRTKSLPSTTLTSHSSSPASTPPSTQPTQPSSPPPQNDTPSPHLQSTKKETKRPSSPTSPTSAKRCIARSVLHNLISILHHNSHINEFPQPEHVIQFLFAEMGTTGSVDGAGRLVIKGRFQQKQVENVLRRYIGEFIKLSVSERVIHLLPVEYVTCKTCKSLDTLLTKENRIFFMACESCGSRRSVNAIKSGFQAQVGKRSKNKTG